MDKDAHISEAHGRNKEETTDLPKQTTPMINPNQPPAKPMSSAEDHKPADPPSAAALDDQDEDQLVDEDAAIVELVTELKEEGTTLFRRRDYDGAAFMFDEAIRLSPRCAAARPSSSARPQSSRNQPLDDEIASLHSNVAACYMHMGTGQPDDEDRHYRQAIERCNMALEASPRYAKALLKRARCYEALDRLDLACADVRTVLGLEPNNVVALELKDNLREEMEEKKLLLEQEARSLDDLIGLISAASEDGDGRSSKTNEQPAGANYGLLQDTQEIHDDKHTSYDTNGGEGAHSSLSEEEHAGEIDQLDIKEEEGAGTDGDGDTLEKEHAGEIDQLDIKEEEGAGTDGDTLEKEHAGIPRL
ncbi:HSP-interacting protein [Brachypodium distachyon]|uniref:HSP-interacting protein n=1 Tax=Brachypodium distachyon TaxID=15368 RepID=UPI0001C70CF8|nr:HSP-interacting protein [Brachypodium distachyon]|eukprot:XP_003575563.3 HSP-interacting protein [Brachypodium distachyon]